MNKIVLIVALFLISCNQSGVENHGSNDAHEQHSASKASAGPEVELNNGEKWNADEATRKNVSSLIQVVQDSSNSGFKNRDRVTAQLQSVLDTLVQECKMKGPEHDALHEWLEAVMQDVKSLKRADPSSYPGAWDRLQRDVQSFHDYFV